MRLPRRGRRYALATPSGDAVQSRGLGAPAKELDQKRVLGRGAQATSFVSMCPRSEARPLAVGRTLPAGPSPCPSPEYGGEGSQRQLHRPARLGRPLGGEDQLVRSYGV